MKLLSSLAALGLFVPSLASAHLHLGPGQFGLQGELLYLKAGNTTEFAIESSLLGDTLEGRVNDPDYEPGFRIEGLYALDCQNVLHGRFTYLNTGNMRESASGIFATPDTFTGTIDDTLKIRYYSVEALFGRWLFDCCDFDLELQAGINYSDIRLNETSDLIEADVVTTIDFESKFWGVGPEIVVNFEYPLPCFCELAVVFDARGSLLASKQTTLLTDLAGVTNETTVYEVVPATDIRLGLSWNHPWNCLRTNIEIGFEWIHFHHGYVDTDASFSGPYFALGVAY